MGEREAFGDLEDALVSTEVRCPPYPRPGAGGGADRVLGLDELGADGSVVEVGEAAMRPAVVADAVAGEERAADDLGVRCDVDAGAEERGAALMSGWLWSWTKRRVIPRLQLRGRRPR